MEEIIKPTLKRYIILFIYGSLLSLQIGCISEYAIIANILKNYYNISMNQVNIASVSGNILNLFLLFPSTYSIKRYGARKNVILSSMLLFLGSIIKCVSIRRDLYYVAVIGQLFTAVSFAFSVPLTLQIPGIWFPAKQISIAISAINSFMVIGGCAVAFAVTQTVTAEDIEIIDSQLRRFMIGQAVVAGVIFFFIILFFDEKPKYKPSIAEKTAQEERKSMMFWESVKKTLNKNFVLVLISVTLAVTVQLSYRNVINEIFTDYFPKKVDTLGTITLVSSLLSVLSLMSLGYLLDKYKCFRLLFIGGMSASCVLNAAFYFGLINYSIIIVFLARVSESIVGISVYTLFYLAPEINYPLPESIASTMFGICEEIGVTTFTFLLTAVIENFGNITAYIVMIFTFLLSIIIFCFVNIELKRTKAECSVESKKDVLLVPVTDNENIL